MTTINTMQDLIQLLRDQPEWAEELRGILLATELRDLPAAVRELAQALATNSSQANEGLARIETELGSLRDHVATLVGQPEEGDQPILNQLKQLDSKVERIDSRLGNVAGTQYEERAAHRAIGRVRTLGIERARIIFSPGESVASFHDAMAQAVDQGLISQEELEDLTATDIILRGANHRHVVIEASLGPDQDDLDRAQRRARTLARATGEDTTPAVAAPELPDELQQQAESLGVAFLQIPA